MDPFLTRPQIKKAARNTMKGHFGTAFALTWLQSIGVIVLMVIIGISVAIFGYLFQTDASFHASITELFKTPKVSVTRNYGGANSTVSFGSSLISTLIATGISFSSLEWLRLPKGEVIERPFVKAFQGFTFKYLLGVIVLYFLTAIIQSIGYFLLVIPGILATYGLRIVYLLYHDQGDKIGYFKLIRLSWEMMRGHKFDLFIFELSFFWWYLGIVITGGLLGLYFYPYHNLAFAGFYDNLYRHSDLIEQTQEEVADDDFPEY
ncbi:hypothetical protein FC15_GL001744 [Lapidilactobacillus concavus DSM 17758]|uniref:Integral membrane protein n=1 Tax=Lapidilactobacillus concavus DSM 17758 TaxID=1423735 RepID=A0A0R1W0W2_9LACO|nr:DUF975 family protein [Lapidilactobacillus concavus]KRM09097.1 hypothetical protein FC15_GL001744 [Lapidilactobacillus concavus DSM 17758]GEL13621.1 membrane protein [Lapidilactobacillus concavus]